jgi:hypothetical protein
MVCIDVVLVFVCVLAAHALGSAVPEDSERQGRGVGSQQAFVLVQCEQACACSKTELCQCGARCIWQYMNIKITNTQPCIDKCIKRRDIQPGEACGTHVRQVQKKKRPDMCNHGKNPDTFTGTVLATSNTAWPDVPLLKNGVWVVPRMENGVVVIP